MFTLPLSLTVALRFSTSSRTNRNGSIVSLISVISTLGIALGVAVLIIGLSAMNGFERELKNRILAIIPQGKITFLEQPISIWSTIIKKIEQVTGIIAAAPYIDFTGLAEHHLQLRAIQIKGVDPKYEEKLSALPNFVLNHAWDYFHAGRQQIILGKNLANTLAVTQGSWLTIMISNHKSTIKLPQPKRIRLQVAGIFQLSSQLDYSLAFIPLEDAQQYLEMGSNITGIEIKVTDVFNAQQLTRNAAEATHSYVNFSSWVNTYGYIYRDIQTIRFMMYLAMILVISVASFNIVSTLVITVKEKSCDIAVLRTLGATDSLIRMIFIWYGVLAGLIGSVSGIIIGSLVSLQLTSIINRLEKLLDHQFFSGKIYFINFFPSELHGIDVIFVLIIVLLLSLFASWYPAQRASKINPARILSGQ
ncbi:lipoprotein-releasing ABC transporter permease subunit LolE [Candidatus Fukatsuia anoeciicola]|uniref:lipoprotein-releasing ABC transporter permease subunit LolE n=1 Tax=Candidatus Fukatsuia anoeciicola TaxID=2994492 RepID=UPI00346470E0